MNVLPHSSASSSTSERSRGAEGVQRSAAASISGSFGRSTRLLRHADSQRVYKQGRRHFGTHMTVFYVCTSQACLATEAVASGPRVGFTVGRVLGGAVQRNRIKRRMREAVRANLSALKVPADVVINPKKSALTTELSQLRDEVARAFSVIQEKCDKE